MHKVKEWVKSQTRLDWKYRLDDKQGSLAYSGNFFTDDIQTEKPNDFLKKKLENPWAQMNFITLKYRIEAHASSLHTHFEIFARPLSHSTMIAY